MTRSRHMEPKLELALETPTPGLMWACWTPTLELPLPCGSQLIIEEHYVSGLMNLNLVRPNIT
jgi:hypothetical protein